MDTMTREQRHLCMSRIRSRDTKPEMIVRRFLFTHGFRYRIHVKKLPGTPDIVMRKYRIAIFVNGCFWHGHDGCSLYVVPRSNTEFWTNKIRNNISRDAKASAKLKSMGWHVVRIWECQLKSAVREHNLQSLLYTINHLTLVNLGVRFKSYSVDDDSYPLAADRGECITSSYT